jgi:hypothetical protein
MTEPERVRAHVFLCMLGYYLEWHMRQSLAPIIAARATPIQKKALDLLDSVRTQ